MLVQIGQPNVDNKVFPKKTPRITAERPGGATIYVEHKCHMKCQHCYESEDTHPTQSRLALEDYKNIFSQLKELGFFYLTITGGEVFLRRDILDIVAEAKRQRFWVKLLTSGTHINETKAKQIADLKIGQVEVSLYSSKAEVHDEFTQIPGSHRRTKEAVRLLRARGVRTVVKTNVMTFNIDDLVEIKRWALSEGAMFTLNPVVDPKMNGDRSPQRFMVPPEEVARKVSSNPFLVEDAYTHDEYEDLCTGGNTIYGPQSNTVCGAASTAVAIDAQGFVYPCVSFTLPAGNILETPLRDIWHGSHLMNQLRDVSYRDFGENGCNSCSDQKTCHPCMAYSYIETKDHLGCSSSSKYNAQVVQAHWDLLKSSAGAAPQPSGEETGPQPADA